jgi:hypothetical protein
MDGSSSTPTLEEKLLRLLLAKERIPARAEKEGKCDNFESSTAAHW